MATVVSLLRSVNVGVAGRLSMEALRELYISLKLQDVQSFIQTGNVLFRTSAKDLPKLARRLEQEIEKKFAFRTSVILRTPADLRDTVARNPFVNRSGIEPSKLLVIFLESAPGRETCEKLLAIPMDPEELQIAGRELFMYFPNGMARPSFSQSVFDRALKIPGTGRNWNTVKKLLALAEKLESGT